MKGGLNLEIPEDRLISLIELASTKKRWTNQGKTTPRRCSQAGEDVMSILIFLHEVTVPRAQLEECSGKLTGLRGEGEKAEITVMGIQLCNPLLEHYFTRGS